MRAVISTEKGRLDLDVIHGFLTSSYWSPGISREKVKKAIEHSFCFGVYLGESQVGFARVITDHTNFAYLADVFVLPEHRGNGLSKLLLSEIMGHSELQGLRRWLLATRDAHGLYQKFGFTSLKEPERIMARS